MAALAESIDRREEILARLLEIVLEVGPGAGVKNVFRNRPEITAGQRPAIVILDSDEEGTLGSFSLGRPVSTPGVMRMNPEVSLLVGGPSDGLGLSLNQLRLVVIKAVLADTTLADLVTTTGGVQYQGCATDLGQGRTLEGLMILNWEIHYPLRPSEM